MNRAGKEGQLPRPDEPVVIPKTLEAEQNFFDQPPFGEVVESISGKTRLKQILLKQALSRYVRAHLDLRVGSQDPHSQSLASALASSEPHPYLRRGLSMMIDTLNRFPSWLDYAESYNAEGQFSLNGDRPRSYSRPEVDIQYPTYSSWVIDKLRREKRIRLSGIEEVFPEGEYQKTNVRKEGKGKTKVISVKFDGTQR